MDPRKTIKVLAILALVFGILGLIISVFAVVGGGALTAVSQNEEIMSQVANDEEVASSLNQFNNTLGEDLDAGTATATVGLMFVFAGIISIISSIFSILEGVFGLKAANGKGANGAFVVGIISVVFNVLNVIVNFKRGLIGAILGLAVAALYTYCAKTIKDQESAEA